MNKALEPKKSINSNKNLSKIITPSTSSPLNQKTSELKSTVNQNITSNNEHSRNKNSKVLEFLLNNLR